MKTLLLLISFLSAFFYLNCAEAYQDYGNTSVINTVNNNVNAYNNLNIVHDSRPVNRDYINITGYIFGSDAPTVGLAGVTITLTGTSVFNAVTDSTGHYIIWNIPTDTQFVYTITNPGYFTLYDSKIFDDSDFSLGSIYLDYISLAPSEVQAVENTGQNAVNLIWSPPGDGSGWLHWDTGEYNDHMNLGDFGSIEIASRWTVGILSAYEGQTLYAIKFFPAGMAQYRVRVWTGGSAAPYDPGTMVVDQELSNLVWGEFNIASLDTPVPIPQNQELWFGVYCNTMGGSTFGYDNHVNDEGLGNLIYASGEWTTLHNASGHLIFNWNLAGFVGFSAPTGFTQLTSLSAGSDCTDTVIASVESGEFPLTAAKPVINESRTRDLLGYLIYRLTDGQENNEATWNLLEDNTITSTEYADSTWNTLPTGTYKWAVKAAYEGHFLSPPAFSNAINWIEQNGFIAGIVRSPILQPVSGATITAGTYTTTSDENGDYLLTVPPGSYTVTCTHPFYLDLVYNLIVVETGDTTILNMCFFVEGNDDNHIVTATSLLGCFPNPFNFTTVINYAIKNPAPVIVEIYNSKGQKIRTLVNETKVSGHFSTVWDGTDEQGDQVSGGLYFYKMTAGKYTSTRKLIFLR